MPVLTVARVLRAAWCWVLLTLAASAAWAHDPFDATTQVAVHAQTIEAKVTLGYDAAQAFLRAGNVPAIQVATMTRNSTDHRLLPLPAALADRLLALHVDDQALTARTVMVAPGESDITVILTYPRPTGTNLRIRAVYFGAIAFMRAGAVVVADDRRALLGSALLSKASAQAVFPLTAHTAAATAGQPGFSAYFKLGVNHILTGFDHLLFLGALLVTMRRLKPMLGIITAFTLAHSVTLALAASGVATLSSAIVEPLIAASIIVVCVENIVRRDATTDRYWMAGVFGLIHGFGFAGALRDTALAQPGSSTVVPLLAFNLGVETGQLCVASVLMALLMLGRRAPQFGRYGVPVLSSGVMLVSAFWLMERIGQF